MTSAGPRFVVTGRRLYGPSLPSAYALVSYKPTVLPNNAPSASLAASTYDTDDSFATDNGAISDGLPYQHITAGPANASPTCTAVSLTSLASPATNFSSGPATFRLTGSVTHAAGSDGSARHRPTLSYLAESRARSMDAALCQPLSAPSLSESKSKRSASMSGKYC